MDGNLLLSSLKDFFDEQFSLCPTCRHLSRKIARPFYELGSLALRMDRNFMRNQFLHNKYGEAWLRGFGLMMKGIEKICDNHRFCGSFA
jgi:hypothetical protein